MDLPGNGTKVRITLEQDEGGKNDVVFCLADGSQLKLSPQQARLLATELIVAVNRAELRSLKRSPTLSRTPRVASADINLFKPKLAK
jgi:hypothetical protein